MATSNSTKEIWFLKLVRKGLLRVTKSGRVFNPVTGKELGPQKETDAYRYVSFKHKGEHKIILLHRLVWIVYKGLPDDPNLELNHKDGNKQNCRLSNLEMTTASGNQRHAIKTGLKAGDKAEENSQALFSNEDVKRLRREFAEGRTSLIEIAERYTVHKLTVKDMLRGKTYSSVKSRYTSACLTKLPIMQRNW